MNGRKKNIDQGRNKLHFAWAARNLIGFDKNIAVASNSVNYVNNIQRIGQIDNIISINQALQVDLYSQVSAESNGFKQVSGNGGMADFVQGAFWSKGGRSFICLPATHTMKDGTLVSNIVPSFETGSIVTVTRHMVHFVVTEFGAVNLKPVQHGIGLKDLFPSLILNSGMT